MWDERVVSVEAPGGLGQGGSFSGGDSGPTERRRQGVAIPRDGRPPSEPLPPLASVCIPAYNCADYIQEAVDSALAQTYPRLEVVIVDNASIDATSALIDQYRDPRIGFFRNPRNLGMEANWNRCLELARGKYITLLPADDLLAPDAVAARVAVLEEPGRESVVFAYSARQLIDRAGRSLVVARFGHRGVVDRARLVRSNVLQGMNVIGEPAAVTFRAETAARVGGFSAGLPYLIDLDYWVRLLAYGDAYAFPGAQCSFRLSGDNTSVRLGRLRRENYLTMIDRMAKLPYAKNINDGSADRCCEDLCERDPKADVSSLSGSPLMRGRAFCESTRLTRLGPVDQPLAGCAAHYGSIPGARTATLSRRAFNCAAPQGRSLGRVGVAAGPQRADLRCGTRYWCRRHSHFRLLANRVGPFAAPLFAARP